MEHAFAIFDVAFLAPCHYHNQLSYAGYTEGRKNQREVRMVDIPATTAGGGDATVEPKEDDSIKALASSILYSLHRSQTD